MIDAIESNLEPGSIRNLSICSSGLFERDDGGLASGPLCVCALCVVWFIAALGPGRVSEFHLLDMREREKLIGVLPPVPRLLARGQRDPLRRGLWQQCPLRHVHRVYGRQVRAPKVCSLLDASF